MKQIIVLLSVKPLAKAIGAANQRQSFQADMASSLFDSRVLDVIFDQLGFFRQPDFLSADIDEFWIIRLE